MELKVLQSKEEVNIYSLSIFDIYLVGKNNFYNVLLNRLYFLFDLYFDCYFVNDTNLVGY